MPGLTEEGRRHTARTQAHSLLSKTKLLTTFKTVKVRLENVI